MPSANAELVRRAHLAYANEGPGAGSTFLTGDAIINTIPEWSKKAVYRGPDGFRELIGEWDRQFTLDFRVAELHDAGEHIVVLLEMGGRDRRTKQALNVRMSSVFSEIRDGRIGRVDYLEGWTSAFELVGLLKK